MRVMVFSVAMLVTGAAPTMTVPSVLVSARAEELEHRSTTRNSAQTRKHFIVGYGESGGAEAAADELVE